MPNATQRAEKRKGLPRGPVPVASTVPSTVPTSTPPAPPPPAPGGQPGTPGPGPASNPPEPRPVGTPAPAPATPRAPARPQPQEEQEEQGGGVATADDGGDDDDGDDDGGDGDDGSGDASTETIPPDLGDRLFAKFDKALESRVDPLIQIINRLDTSTMRLQAQQEQMSSGMTNMKKSIGTIATLAAQQEKLRSTLAVVEGRLIDPVQFRQELQADIQAAVAAEVEQRTSQPVTVQVPTPPPAQVVTNTQAPQPQVATVASPTLDEIRNLIQAELAGLRTQAPAIAPPVPTTVNTPGAASTIGDRLEAGVASLHPAVNPITKVIWDAVRSPYDVAVGLGGMMTLPPDCDIRIEKNQASTTEATKTNVYSQQFLRGFRCAVPLAMGVSAGYTAYQAGAGITTLGEFGGTTMVTLKAGSLPGALAAGGVAFALGTLAIAVWVAWAASKALARKEELAQAELRANQAAQAAIASMSQPSVSQPRAS
jgi:hypothetical protein